LFSVAALSRAPDARASVAIAVSWDDLVSGSSAAAFVTADSARAVWEGGRIYTYTHVQVDRAVAGELTTGSTAWVRTRGGVVDHVGQQVEGEAVFGTGQSLVFLHATGAGAFDVTGRAQGQFPVVAGDSAQPAHVVPCHARGMIVARSLPTPALPPKLASDVLAGQTPDDATRAIGAAWSAAHAH
jgi:hypothetical protein